MSVAVGHEPKVDRPEAPPAPSAAAPPPRPPRRLSRARAAVLLAAPLAAAAVAWGGSTAAFLSLRETTPAPAPAAAAPDGPRLYALHCAYCHGERGDGQGTTRLDPPARDFGTNRFKLATTHGGVPTDADLLGVIRRGLPGSAMPAFPEEKLSDDEALAVIEHVRVLTRAGLYEKFRKKTEDAGEEFDPAYAAGLVAKAMQPGQPLEIPRAFSPATPAGLARGRVVYEKVCAQCHGARGNGDGPQVKDLKNEDQTPARPRDFTAGVFKGGRDPKDLYARILLGMPGTPMPANPTLTAQEVDDLIGYVLSLSQPGGPSAPVAAAGQ
jgi:cytochrome c oxidase cbb3-type subunit 2